MYSRQLVTITQKGASFDFAQNFPSPVQSGLYLPAVLLYEMKRHTDTLEIFRRTIMGLFPGEHKPQSPAVLTNTGRGFLIIANTVLTFMGDSRSISIPLARISKLDPYPDGIGIYEDGRPNEYRFIWGDNIDMLLVAFPSDDGAIKPLSGSIISRFIGDLKKQNNIMI